MTEATEWRVGLREKRFCWFRLRREWGWWMWPVVNGVAIPIGRTWVWERDGHKHPSVAAPQPRMNW